MAQTFAEALKQQLEKAGISAYRLSQLTGTSQPGMSKILSGKTQPSWDTVLKICEALKVSCTVFRPDEVTLPEPTEERGRGRPKESTAETTKPADESPSTVNDKGAKKPVK